MSGPLNRDVGLKKMKIVGLLLFACLSAGCLSTSDKYASASRWTTAELVGNTFTLVDATRYAQYTFQENGNAIATIGQIDGPVAGPVMRWHITRAGALVISDEASQIIWIKKERDKDRVVVITDTGDETYLRHNNEANKAFQAIGDKSPQPER